jgi:hypothetical protein
MVGKYLAYLACTSMAVAAAVALVFAAVVDGATWSDALMLAGYLGTLVLGLAAYGALFALMGASLERPLVIGLLFAFGWEQVALLVPGYLRRFTIAYHLQSVIREPGAAGISLVCLTAITAGCLFFATRAVERREYVLEQ